MDRNILILNSDALMHFVQEKLTLLLLFRLKLTLKMMEKNSKTKNIINIKLMKEQSKSFI